MACLILCKCKFFCKNMLFAKSLRVMKKPLHIHLSRCESQIMDIVYRLGEASVADVVGHMPDEPAYNSVRVTLSILERKGYVKHRREKRRFLYSSVLSPARATRSAMSHMMKTFFKGSPSRAILTMLDMSSAQLSKQELAEIAEWIEKAKEEAE